MNIDAPQALYRFFAANGDLLYVGVSLNPGGRWKQHRSDKPWWIEVATVTIEAHPDRQSVLVAERDAIERERPKYNLAHNHDARESGERMASLLKRMSPPPETYWDACKTCGTAILPTEVHASESGWAVEYDCCAFRWAREIEAA